MITPTGYTGAPVFSGGGNSGDFLDNTEPVNFPSATVGGTDAQPQGGYSYAGPGGFPGMGGGTPSYGGGGGGGGGGGVTQIVNVGQGQDSKNSTDIINSGGIWIAIAAIAIALLGRK